MPAGLQIPRGRPWISTGGSRTHFSTPKKHSICYSIFDGILIPKISQRPQKIGPKSIKKTSDFLLDVLTHFGSILGAFFHHFCFQKYVRTGKGDFIKMSFSCTRSAHFQGFRPPRSIQKSMKKTIEKMNTFLERFWMVWGAIL